MTSVSVRIPLGPFLVSPQGYGAIGLSEVDADNLRRCRASPWRADPELPVIALQKDAPCP